MFEKILQKAELTATQAEILSFLYQNEKAKASEIAKKIKKSRAIVYMDLEELADKGLIKKTDKPNQVSFFTAEHPNKLEGLIKTKVKQVKKDEQEFNNYLPDLVSAYNLTQNKPGVKFYEGEEGIKKVIYDTFTSKETVFTYADIETINKYIKEINDAYAKKRDEAGLKKKIIFSDTPYSRERLKTYHTATTDSKIIPGLTNFHTVMQIYDNKISYITLSDKKMIGIIIESEEIYQMQKILFENAWKSALAIS